MYVWLRRFDSEAERERLYREVYQSDHWKQHLSPRVGELLDREQIVVTRLTPTPRSVIRNGAPPAARRDAAPPTVPPRWLFPARVNIDVAGPPLRAPPALPRAHSGDRVVSTADGLLG